MMAGIDMHPIYGLDASVREDVQKLRGSDKIKASTGGAWRDGSAGLGLKQQLTASELLAPPAPPCCSYLRARV